MKIDELLNKCAKELPEGYSIKIGVENGAAWVYLITDQNERQDVNGEHWDYRIEHEVLFALKKAKLMAEIQNKQNT